MSNTVKCRVFSLMCVIFFYRFHSRALLIPVAGTIVHSVTIALFIGAIQFGVHHDHNLDHYFLMDYTCSIVPAFVCSYGLFYMCYKCLGLHLFYCISVFMFSWFVYNVVNKDIFLFTAS